MRANDGLCGGGLNHLCEVEVPEVLTESVGGRMISLHMWQPPGDDLLCNPLLLGQARRSSGNTICRSQKSWLRQCVELRAEGVRPRPEALREH